MIVTVKDENGDWVNQSPTVTLEVIDGPGVFPTGKVMTLTGGNLMRDGKGATEFRSYYSGTTVIEATAPGWNRRRSPSPPPPPSRNTAGPSRTIS